MNKLKKTEKSPRNSTLIYQAPSGAIELRGDSNHENIWATLDQMSVLFGRDKSVISRHLKNIFKDGELNKAAVVAKNATTAADGKTYMVEFYNLDVIISVGYRINSKVATQFRKWATKTLRQYIVEGYTINRRRIGDNYSAFIKAVDDVMVLLPSRTSLNTETVLDLVKEFASTWVSLDAYDKGGLKPIGISKKKVQLDAKELIAVINEFKNELSRKGEATELFARERSNGAVEGILGNVLQSFGGKTLYPSVEEKAAHLLYFIVKNHPFSDGNKRSGAFAFIWFLRRFRSKSVRTISPGALTAVALLVAESDPKNKQQIVALITQIITPTRNRK
ncbi:MAG: virulence protein RhuM/Fic/DOC family protein [Candidatus Paceibacterota bacterium]